MHIGVPKEIKTLENRVALTPEQAGELVSLGHELLIERGAGTEAGFPDDQYSDLGARLVSAADAWLADLVVKVKEPVASEYPRLRGQMLFTFLHLAGAPPELTTTLLESGTTGIAYETVEAADGSLCLLAPMSAVAGNMAVLVGAQYLAKHNGGCGVQLGSVNGERHGRVLVIGDGVVGGHAAAVATGMGAEVTLLGRNESRLAGHRHSDAEWPRYLWSEPDRVAELIVDADLVVGAVLLKGARAPHVVTETMVRSMKPGAVIVDVAIDQGGCVETARPTSHEDPVYRVHGVIHYCVTNMPGAYPHTATRALTAATFPYVQQLAQSSIDALRTDPGFAKGLNTYRGHITCKEVAQALQLTDRYQAFPGP